jgi:IS30 family transposase
MGRIARTPVFKAEVWRRWKAGENLGHIAKALGTGTTILSAMVEASGGIAPRARCRSRLALTLGDREEISRGLEAQRSIREIARHIGRAPSTVSREIARNVPLRWMYRAHRSERRAWDRALRPKPCRLAQDPILARLVAQKLELDWSPQQISGWLARAFPNDESMRVSHETIYKTLFVQARGVLKKELTAHLRRGRMLRRSRQNQGRVGLRIADAVSIRERPAGVEDRAVPGHWEGDLLVGGSNHTQIATLVERHSRFVMLVKVPSKDTEVIVKALARNIRKLPKHLRRSLTWDRGSEMAGH